MRAPGACRRRARARPAGATSARCRMPPQAAAPWAARPGSLRRAERDAVMTTNHLTPHMAASGRADPNCHHGCIGGSDSSVVRNTLMPEHERTSMVSASRQCQRVAAMKLARKSGHSGARLPGRSGSRGRSRSGAPPASCRARPGSAPPRCAGPEQAQGHAHTLRRMYASGLDLSACRLKRMHRATNPA